LRARSRTHSPFLPLPFFFSWLSLLEEYDDEAPKKKQPVKASWDDEEEDGPVKVGQDVLSQFGWIGRGRGGFGGTSR
jgi:hypothetical protein